ncbi:MAG: Ig-like domain-containing protein, partial [Terracidiphilus sp.]
MRILCPVKFVLSLGFFGILSVLALALVGCGALTTNGYMGTPDVTAVTPTSGATGVAITSAVTASFNAALNSATLTTSTFTLTPQGGSAVTGAVSYNSTTFVATLTPSSPLAYS